jgi:hypothetical protein
MVDGCVYCTSTSTVLVIRDPRPGYVSIPLTYGYWMWPTAHASESAADSRTALDKVKKRETKEKIKVQNS